MDARRREVGVDGTTTQTVVKKRMRTGGGRRATAGRIKPKALEDEQLEAAVRRRETRIDPAVGGVG